MIDTKIKTNDSILQRFGRLAQASRMAHAYLFIGPPSSGKSETAKAIAKMMNCEKSGQPNPYFCDSCPSCVQNENGHHPDLHVIDNIEEDTIKIEQVRGLLDQIKLRPYMGAKKIFIIKNAERMTLESANALLKTLEEPSASSILFLTTSYPEKILDTIKSRCHAIYFLAISPEELAQQLQENYNCHGDEARFIAYYAEGCLGTAVKYLESKTFQRKNEIISEFILSPDNDAFVKKVLSDKTASKDFLHILLTWVRDAMLFKAGVQDKRLIHGDRLKDLQLFAKRFTFAQLNDLDKAIVSMCNQLAENLNVKIPLLIIKEKLWVN